MKPKRKKLRYKGYSLWYPPKKPWTLRLYEWLKEDIKVVCIGTIIGLVIVFVLLSVM